MNTMLQVSGAATKAQTLSSGFEKQDWPLVLAELAQRVKHWMKRNWIKMYNKNSTVLRVETVINHPYDFRIYRSGRRSGKTHPRMLPHSRRWRITRKGLRVLGPLIEVYA